MHAVCTTAASVSDKHMLIHLLHGEETKVWGDGGYQGQTEAIRQAAPKAKDMTCRRTRFRQYVDELQRQKNRTKSLVRARVEHPFRILKRVFGFDKVRYAVWPRTIMAVRHLRADRPVSPPQTPGRPRGVVCPMCFAVQVLGPENSSTKLQPRAPLARGSTRASLRKES